MLPRRTLQSAAVAALLLTLACSLTATPLEGTPAPASPSSTPAPVVTRMPATSTPGLAPTGEAPLVQIGLFDSMYLRYDPGQWEADSGTPEERLNERGEPIHRLQHLSIPGCILHDNLGRGAPPTWERNITNRTIGSLEFRVEAWTDTELGQPVLIVYQHPPGEDALGKRIELLIEAEPEACIRSAEEVLALSADVIAAEP
jgi:hypothetical protein